MIALARDSGQIRLERVKPGPSGHFPARLRMGGVKVGSLAGFGAWKARSYAWGEYLAGIGRVTRPR
jgi:hypothetical protein